MEDVRVRARSSSKSSSVISSSSSSTSMAEKVVEGWAAFRGAGCAYDISSSSSESESLSELSA